LFGFRAIELHNYKSAQLILGQSQEIVDHVKTKVASKRGSGDYQI
jgi:hypothetical protein